MSDEPLDVGLSLSSACVYSRPSQEVASGAKQKLINSGTHQHAALRWLSGQFVSRLQRIQKQLYNEFLQEIASFLSANASVSPNKLAAQNRLAPVGIVTIGCSVTEYGFVFELLKQKVNQQSGLEQAKLILISSNESGSFDDLLQHIYREVLEEPLLASNTLLYKHRRWYQHLTFEQFIGLYCQNVSKTMQGSDSIPLIVLLLENVISFSSDSLQRLVNMAQKYSDKIRIILLCFMPNTSVSIQSIFRAKTLSQMRLHCFNSKSMVQTFDEVINLVFFDHEVPLRFGPMILNHLIETFLWFDYSMQKIQQLILIVLFDYCYSNVHSILCRGVEHYVQQVHLLDSTNVLALHSLDSMKKYMKEDLLNDPTTLNDSKFMKQKLIDAYHKFHEEIKRVLTETRNFYYLVDEMPGNPFGISFQSFYISFLKNDEEYEKDLTRLAVILQMLSLEEWQTRIQTCLTRSNEQISKVTELLREQSAKLDDLFNESNIHRAAEVEEEPKLDLSGLKNREEFRQRLQQKIKKPKKSTGFDLWKEQTIHALAGCLKQLARPKQLPLHELFYYDDLAFMRNCNLTNLRGRVTLHLRNPSKMLGFDSSKDSAQTPSKGLTSQNSNKTLINTPDISLAFRFYEESQTKINIRDWFEAFKYSAEINENMASPSKKARISKIRSKSDFDTQALRRFFSAMSDLEFLGFIQKAPRKRDHAVKLIFP